jgi:catechol 2,3-dioxygenase-like lactoylglutathione lyase family enzyme
MVDWYTKVLGMTTNFQSMRGEVGASVDIAFVSNDRAHHRMALVSWPGMREDGDTQPHAKLQHVAFEYATTDDLLNSWERLKGLEIELVLTAGHGPTTAFYYQDPDGNSVELFVDNFGDWDKSTEYVRTSPEFHQNSMGTSAAGIEYQIEPLKETLPSATDAVLAWTVREGVTNVIGHSRARHCTITLKEERGRIWAEVLNDGRTLELVESIPERSGLGLAGLRERVTALGGHMEVGPLPPSSKEGFRLQVDLPMKPDGKAPALQGE